MQGDSALIEGKCWVFGDHVDTDQIIPARYLNTSDPAELGKHCMEDADPSFPNKVKPGDIIVAGMNFGCGSSREHAPIAIRAAGVSCVIAASFARIFFRNAINIGLPIFESPEIRRMADEGDIIQADPTTGALTIARTGETVQCAAFPPELLAIIESGGLMSYVKTQLTGTSAE